MNLIVNICLLLGFRMGHFEYNFFYYVLNGRHLLLKNRVLFNFGGVLPNILDVLQDCLFKL